MQTQVVSFYSVVERMQCRIDSIKKTVEFYRKRLEGAADDLEIGWYEAQIHAAGQRIVELMEDLELYKSIKKEITAPAKVTVISTNDYLKTHFHSIQG